MLIVCGNTAFSTADWLAPAILNWAAETAPTLSDLRAWEHARLTLILDKIHLENGWVGARLQGLKAANQPGQ